MLRLRLICVEVILVCYCSCCFAQQDTINVANDTTYTHFGDLPEVSVHGFASRKPLDIKLDMKKIQNDIVLKNPPQGFNILGPIIWAIQKIFPKKHKETNKERAKRICEAY